MTRDDAGMIAAVLDKPAAGVESAAHRAGQIHPAAVGFMGFGVEAWRQAFTAEIDAHVLQELVIRPVARKREHPVVVDPMRAVGLGLRHRRPSNLPHTRTTDPTNATPPNPNL